jgi:hypothetical protein
MWNYLTGGTIQSAPAVASGLVYVGSVDGSVFCVNASTGTLAWNCATGGALQSSPAVAGGYIFISSYDGSVYCLPIVLLPSGNTLNSTTFWVLVVLGISAAAIVVIGVVVYFRRRARARHGERTTREQSLA